ncbi:MAG: YkgJ family cysteine cluster protein [Desulfamplus sp.]|nr:YkgJ family cysteine cluster protein [Desulfamplus sp.]
MSEELTHIAIDDPLPFNCSSDLSCFNKCCQDLNQFLTPYDILRLKRNLGITSDIFLKRYTSRHNGPESGLPIITFKPDPASGHACPFVRDFGCSVYLDRPASCRMYPIARAVSRCRQTGELTEHFALIEEPHCCGFTHKNSDNQLNQQDEKRIDKWNLTVREWLKTQDVDIHNMMNDKMLEIISLKNRIIPGKLDGADSENFYLACYDIDTFRAKIFENGEPENGFLKDVIEKYNISEFYLKKIKTDDVALMEFGLAWVKNMLFGVEITL